MPTTLTPDNDCSHSPPQMADTKPYNKVTLIGRAIYYVLGVSSLIGLAYSIGVLWPSKKEDGSLVEIPISRYLAVVLASFYVVGLARTLFFDRPPPTQKIGPHLEWFYPLCVFIAVFVFALIYKSKDGLLFSVSVITCGIAIVQLTHPIEEFNVVKSLWVIFAALTTGGCFTKTDSVGVAILGALSAMYIGIFSIVLVSDLHLENAEFCSGCFGRLSQLNNSTIISIVVAFHSIFYLLAESS